MIRILGLHAVGLILLLGASQLSAASAAKPAAGYSELVRLFEDWRAFERPPLRNGAPDYTAARFDAAYKELETYKARLQGIDTQDWPVDQQVDWHLARAEMNGFDFNYRVLKPWQRDPAFYQSVWPEQSDVPAHEGPTNHALLELWTYKFPLSPQEQIRMLAELRVIPPLLEQARGNLTGNARDLWIAGTRNFVAQQAALDGLSGTLGHDANADLLESVRAAHKATVDFIRWLEAQAPTKTGPSGVGKENYTWYQKNVHYVPFTWDQEVDLLQRELHRAWASLKLEEQRNRNIPPLVAAQTPEELARMADHGATRLMAFLKDRQIMPIKANMEPALREHPGKFVEQEKRNFFDIGLHYDPVPLYTHFYHWFELAQMRDEPHASPLRRGPLLYNIFDSRNEGTATGVEEMFMHAGLYDDSPHSREIVWIMLAARAARGLGSLYAHANMMTMAEAGEVHVNWTPRGWMKVEPELLKFEQHLYLRQPGYGTSYVTGKYLLEKLLADRARQLESQDKVFSMTDFFREMNDAGCIPTTLTNWQLTGDDSVIREMLRAP